MNIVLYKRGTTNFNNNGLGILAEAFDVSVKDTINDLFVCDFKYPITGRKFSDLANGDIIKVDASPLLKEQRFTIQTITHDDKGYISVHCLHKMIADMSTDYLKESISSTTSQSCAYAMNLAFNKSYKCKNYIAKTDIVNGNEFNISRRNLQNVLLGKEGSIIDTFGNGAEIEYNNSKGDVVSILKRRGHETNVLISYAKNISGYNCVMDVQELYTVIVPFAVNNNTRETIYGAEVYAPNWEEFNGELYIKEQDFTDRFEQGEEITREKLKKHAENYLLETKCNEPKFTFKIDFVQLENKYLDEYNLDALYEVNIGDTVYVHHRLYNVRTQARINSIVYDPGTSKITKLVIGDVRPVFTSGSLAGKDGHDGAPGKDGSIETLPDILPEVPRAEAHVYGVGTVEITWTFDNKFYFDYEVYASSTKGFTPTIFDRIFSGKASATTHQVTPPKTMYYKVRAVNSHGKFTAFSNEAEVSVKRIEDMNNYFSEIAIGRAVVQSLTADYMEAGIIKANWVEFKGASVVDGNGKRTFDIDSFGSISGDFTSLNFQSEGIESVVANAGNLIPNTDLKNGLEGWNSTDNSYLVINEGSFTDMVDYKNQASRVHFIYGYPNGQSDCQLIQTVTGLNILIDAGLDTQGGSFVKYLKDLGITRLDYVFVTHAHSDHIGGMPDIIDNFDIGVFYGVNPDPSILDQEEIEWETMKYWQRVKDALRRKNMDVTWPVAGIQLSKYDRLDVYNIKEPTPKMNDMSLVLKYTHMSNKIVLSGDVEFADEDRIASQIGKVDVLKLGHHGLDTSTGYAYITKLKPNMTITTSTANLASQRIPVLTRLQLEGITKNLTLGTQGTIVITSDGTRYASSFNQDFSLYNKWGKAYNKDYFFDWGGKPVDGFRTIFTYDTRNVDYYFKDEAMQVGWIEISQGEGKLSKWYYSADGTDGVYYVGELVKGFYEVSWNAGPKTWYYFDNSTHEMLRAKWVKHNDNYWYYLKDNGEMAKSETLNIDGVDYTFDTNGRMQ